MQQTTPTNQITTLTFFKYKGLKNKVWAFGMMQFAHQYLAIIKGMRFYKLMGSGKGLGFSPLPDWSIYTLLQVWDDEERARAFFKESTLMPKYVQRTEEIGTFFMRNIAAHGLWSEVQPFDTSNQLSKQQLPIAVITRATIRTKQLYRFWRYVPIAQEPIKNASGLFYTKGIGEVPIKQMATFSLWDSLDSVKAYAYKTREHAEAISMTKKYDWYSEELFSRFQVFDMEGSWAGVESSIAE